MNHLLQLAAPDNAPTDVTSIAQATSFDSPVAADLNDR